MTITGYQKYDKITVKANKEQSLSEMYLAVVQKILYNKKPEGIEIEGLEEYNTKFSLSQNTTSINRGRSSTVSSLNGKQQQDSDKKKSRQQRQRSLSM